MALFAVSLILQSSWAHQLRSDDVTDLYAAVVTFIVIPVVLFVGWGVWTLLENRGVVKGNDFGGHKAWGDDRLANGSNDGDDYGGYSETIRKAGVNSDGSYTEEVVKDLQTLQLNRQMKSRAAVVIRGDDSGVAISSSTSSST